ncbi:MAG TPA: rhamnose ABC transporter substrate-binding protein [Povalibacter sp.]|nr:rhamnose ABC transporter substrate-binding protein [Povalibacter sp.]
MTHRRTILAVLLGMTMAVTGCDKRTEQPAKARHLRIGIVAKSLGNTFFDAVHQGADEAATSLDAEVIFTGPTTPTAEGQIEVINALIAQRVDAIAVSANDPDALVPSLQRAMQKGIKVLSYDSAVARPGRIVHLAPASDQLIGQTCVQLAAELTHEARGKFAVLSASAVSTNQNDWLAAIRAALPEYPGLNLVSVAYGDDVADKSYDATLALIEQHPDLSVIVAISSVAIVAAARAVDDQGLSGRIRVTGLGMPSELADYVRRGVVPKFAIWNPVDLGYAATQLAAHLVRGDQPSESPGIAIGRLGRVSFDSHGVGAMASPLIYDASNVQASAKVF